MGQDHLSCGNFLVSVDAIVSFIAPQHDQTKHINKRDYPWRRGAYDRTLSCPDLARVINDFLSSDVEFLPKDDVPAHLHA